MKAILYSMRDGSVSLGRIEREGGGYSSGIERRLLTGMKLDAAIAEVAEKSKPDGCQSWRVIDSADLPGGAADASYEKTFFGAFEVQRRRIVVNMTKARAIQMDRIRAAREVALQALDVETIKAVGTGDHAERARVETEKKRLRDIPQTLDLGRAKTPEELKALWPEGLPRPASSE